LKRRRRIRLSRRGRGAFLVALVVSVLVLVFAQALESAEPRVMARLVALAEQLALEPVQL